MAETIYTLCALLSSVCAFLLLRQRRGAAGYLILWSGIGFLGLALSNILLVADLVLLPTVDLAVWRTGTAVVAMLALLFGFVWQPR